MTTSSSILELCNGVRHTSHNMSSGYTGTDDSKMCNNRTVLFFIDSGL